MAWSLFSATENKERNLHGCPGIQLLFVETIKFYCVTPAAPVLSSQPCVLAGNVTFRQDRAWIQEPGMYPEQLEAAQGCTSISFLSMQIFLKVASN